MFAVLRLCVALNCFFYSYSFAANKHIHVTIGFRHNTVDHHATA